LLRHRRVLQRAFDVFDFRMANVDDVPALVDLFEQFFSETGYQNRGIRYSRERSGNWLHRAISTGETPHLVATKDSRIVGSVSWGLDTTFCEDPVAIMHTVYVVPEHRRSAVGRILVTFMGDLAKQDGACALHAPIAAEMPEQPSLINLFTREGYASIGAILGRRL
jgi:L-amino acid N-acyltransferase YncA